MCSFTRYSVLLYWEGSESVIDTFEIDEKGLQSKVSFVLFQRFGANGLERAIDFCERIFNKRQGINCETNPFHPSEKLFFSGSEVETLSGKWTFKFCFIFSPLFSNSGSFFKALKHRILVPFLCSMSVTNTLPFPIVFLRSFRKLQLGCTFQ